ncbi:MULTISPECIES: NepR family anti-sigma factor [Mesorhizobium]|uniref:NepR family anti-sigma factor n=1 Tax=Mesorhizobium TaxID=68287 RepID=UPI00247A38CC|nr:MULTISPECIES: NepR family anti-sigma factor [Mesorhizobium]
MSEKKPKGGQAAAALGPNAEIGRKLKQYYESLIVDEVPDRFAQLLSQLESVETKLEKD